MFSAASRQGNIARFARGGKPFRLCAFGPYGNKGDKAANRAEVVLFLAVKLVYSRPGCGRT